MRSLLLLSLGLVAACGGGSEPPTSPAPATSASAAPVVAASVSAAPEADPPKKRRPYEIYNACADVTTIAFGEDPRAPGVGTRTIAPNSAIDGPRDAEGNATIWLFDIKGEPLVKVHVTRGMKRVEIGKSCRTLDAR